MRKSSAYVPDSCFVFGLSVHSQAMKHIAEARRCLSPVGDPPRSLDPPCLYNGMGNKRNVRLPPSLGPSLHPAWPLTHSRRRRSLSLMCAARGGQREGGQGGGVRRYVSGGGRARKAITATTATTATTTGRNAIIMGYAGVSYVQPQCRMSVQVIGVLNHVGELFGSRISLTARLTWNGSSQ